MHFTPRDVGGVNALSSFLSVLAITGFFQSALSIPTSVGSSLQKRANYDPPGLGVELEFRKILFESTKAGWASISDDDKQLLKGATVTPNGFGGDQSNWKITLENSITLSELPYVELITDGKNNVIGQGGTSKIGTSIYNYMTGWNPCRNNQCQVTIKVEGSDALDKYNPWSVKWPTNPIGFDNQPLSPQVTAAMPLEGVLQVLKDTKNGGDDSLAGQRPEIKGHIVLPSSDGFKSFGKISPIDINDQFLGFFSLLTSYCVASKYNTPKQGPKYSLTIMPRTDFLTMYKTFVEGKIKSQLADCKTSLYDIVSALSGIANDGLKDYTFKWQAGTLRNTGDQDWNGKADMISKGQLNIKTFLDTLQNNDPVAGKQLDLLALMDQSARNGQIGGYGSRMESIMNAPTIPAPIFEFRDLNQVPGSALSTTMGSYEDKAKDLHSKASAQEVALGIAGAIAGGIIGGNQGQCEVASNPQQPSQPQSPQPSQAPSQPPSQPPNQPPDCKDPLVWNAQLGRCTNPPPVPPHPGTQWGPRPP